jgi:hypothetical protein
MGADAGPVRGQVPERHEGVGRRIGQVKARQMLADRVVPGELPFVYQDGGQRRGECLRTGG